MTTAAEHKRYEQILAHVLRAPDPVAALRAQVAALPTVSPLRQALSRIDEDGFRLSALMVARLRFERLLQGFPDAAREFEEDPAGFTNTFSVYHQQVPLRAFSPQHEARLYARWLRKTKLAGGQTTS